MAACCSVTMAVPGGGVCAWTCVCVWWEGLRKEFVVRDRHRSRIVIALIVTLTCVKNARVCLFPADRCPTTTRTNLPHLHSLETIYLHHQHLIVRGNSVTSNKTCCFSSCNSTALTLTRDLQAGQHTCRAVEATDELPPAVTRCNVLTLETHRQTFIVPESLTWTLNFDNKII